MKYLLSIAALAVLLFASCDSINFPKKKLAKKVKANPTALETALANLNLPKGFKINTYAEGVKNARSLEFSPNGTLYVGTRGEGNVYALRDEDGDFKAEKKYTLATGLNMPNGVAFRDGDLYVAEVNRILRYKDIEQNLSNPPEPEVVFDGYPTETHHGWKYIAFGPDGKLFVPVGAPCNICEREEKVYSSITRLDVETKEMEVVQHGVRNTVGFTWHPDTKELWFTDNGRDMMGDDLPGCELNHAPEDGMHFGYPYCHQGDVPDDKYGEKRNCSEFTPPAQVLMAHVAPLGIEFYTGNMFPEKYKKQILFAEHGSWNRSKKSGYRVMMVTLENGKATSYEPFVDGWLDKKEDEAWGRPVDLEHLPDGSLLISDDFADMIYRVWYEQ
jgi:glucose/arabinose dehydrogenase